MSSITPLVDRYGPWALVTGSSSGIGKEFATRLAAGGFNLILVARRGALLEALAVELTEAHGVRCQVVVADLSAPGASDEILGAVGDLDVGLIVHNAGTGWIGRFDRQAVADHAALVQLHCTFPVTLTAAWLPRLRSRNRAGILVVGSLGGFMPLPYYSVYGATKAFLLNWGEALACELADDGIDVLVVAPGDTKTDFQRVAGERSTRHSDVADVVREALAGLGRRSLVIPGLENRATVFLLRFLPRAWVTRIAASRQRAQAPPERV